jgi:hypothetical protein
MRVRSWMAALALIGVTSILIGRGLSAQGSGNPQQTESSKGKEAKKPDDAPPQAKPRKDGETTDQDRKAPGLPVIQLNLAIAGLGGEGCDVEIKPANASCKFRPTPRKHVESDGRAMIELRDVELRGADKMCSVAITVREPGQEPQTIYRGFRTTPPKPGATPSVTCFISSKMAEVDSKTTRK